MTERNLCPLCRHENPPENRFCGSCGVSLEAGSELVVRRENNLTVMGHALPTKLGPAGKALAAELVTLAAEVGLSWLRHRTRAEDRPLTLTTPEPETAVSGRLLGGRSLEEVLIQELQGEYRSPFLAWRAARSFVITEPTDRRS
jgi:hypothetical protein